MRPLGKLNLIQLPSRPWGSLSMDFIIELPTSGGYNSILVIIDCLTKFGLFIPCKKTINASQLASLS